MSAIRLQLNQDIKDAMKAKDKARLDVLRLISAAVKQIEVDERIDVDDSRMLVILNKMVKQRHESIAHYSKALRDDLVAQENYELSILKNYLPEPLSEESIKTVIDDAFVEIKVSQVSDMGKLMAYIKPKIEGRADMAKISALIKQRLTQVLG